MRCLLLSGATGFIGSYCAPAFAQLGYQVIPLSHKEGGEQSALQALYALKQQALQAKEPCSLIVIHAAGLAHARGHSRQDYFHANYRWLETVYHLASRLGAERFIFLSTVKVFGAQQIKHSVKQPLTVHLEPEPDSFYGITKREAELFLERESVTTGAVPVSVLRLPLVYAESALKGNLAFLQKALEKGLPNIWKHWPNQRTLMTINAVYHALKELATQQNLPHYQLIHPTQVEQLSTAAIVEKLAIQRALSPLVLALPYWLLHFLAMLTPNSFSAPIFGDIVMEPGRFFKKKVN